MRVRTKLVGSFGLVLAFVVALAIIAIVQSFAFGSDEAARPTASIVMGFIAIALLLTAIGIAALLAYLANRDIIWSIAEVSRVAEAVSTGDLSQRAAIATRDEFFEMGQSLERMARYLEDIEAFAVSVAGGELETAARRVDPLGLRVSVDTPKARLTSHNCGRRLRSHGE